MSASPRPTTASPRSSVYVWTTSPESPISESFGPDAKRPAPRTCVPLLTISTDTRWPTRLPQRPQKRSTPFVYVAPHCPQLAASVIIEMRPPQWPQNGNPAVTILPQRGQFASDTRVCGTTPPAPGEAGPAAALAPPL